jgi:hypothetical protein
MEEVKEVAPKRNSGTLSQQLATAKTPEERRKILMERYQ